MRDGPLAAGGLEATLSGPPSRRCAVLTATSSGDESVDLDLSSRRRQDEIEARLLPDGWWVPLAWALHAAQAERATVGRELVERAVRGWTEADLRDLQDVLPPHRRR